MSDILRELVEERLYGPGASAPTKEQVREYVCALYERRPSKLDESEVERVRTWITIEGVRRAIRERRWMLVLLRDRQDWQDWDDFCEKIMRLAEEKGVTYEVLERKLYALVEELEARAPRTAGSPEELESQLIEEEKQSFLRRLDRMHRGNVSREEELSLSLWLEDVLALEMVERFRLAVSRAWAIRSGLAGELPSERVLGRLEEAYECYQYSLYQACIALCRTVLEYSLKECLEDAHIPLRLDYVRSGGELRALIRQARESRILSPGLAAWADEIRMRGNSCVHDRAVATDDLCSDTLDKLRHILARLYK